jgi:hypothetical protein
MQRRKKTHTDGPVPLLADPALLGLVDRARLLDALDAVLREALPETIANQCRLANVKGKRLVFLASSSTVAARLRLLADVLYQAARTRAGQTYTHLTIKVARLPARPQGDQSQNPLSHAAAKHLTAAADAVTDPELADLLRRLASLA